MGTPHAPYHEGKVVVITVGVASSLAAIGDYNAKQTPTPSLASAWFSRPGFVMNSGSYPAAEQSRTLALDRH